MNGKHEKNAKPGIRAIRQLIFNRLSGIGFKGAQLNWFKQLFSANKTASMETDLVFKSGQDALEYSCKFMDCTLGEKKSVPALVIDARGFAPNIESAVKTEADKSQIAIIRVASRTGGFVIPAKTSGTQSSIRPDLAQQRGYAHGHPDLKPGDFVTFTAMIYKDELAEKFGDRDAGWVGLITSKLEPKLNTQNGPSWQIEEQFHG